jgi:hypothetical protein
MAFRLGYRPGGWEHLQPVELYAVRDADEWRRVRDLGALAIAVTAIASRIPFAKPPRPEELTTYMAAYEPDEERDGAEG